MEQTFFTIAIALGLTGEPVVLETFNNFEDCQQVRSYLERKRRVEYESGARTIARAKAGPDASEDQIEALMTELLTVECHATTYKTGVK